MLTLPWSLYNNAKKVLVKAHKFQLHTVARIVEKLLNLEIEIICQESHIFSQIQVNLTKEDLLANLAANINRRDIRQGNFRFFFDKSGKPEPVKLNKDAAMAIISPVPVGLENLYPHVLTNVLFHREAEVKLTPSVNEYLKLPSRLTDLQWVSLIWESMYIMLSLIKVDPDPVLKEGRPEGSLHAEDYTWEYGTEHLEKYRFHAERFYQLFCARYKSHNLTPYMCKLIDYGLLFMKKLPVPIVRFQAEAGEHANYLHSTFYYAHTTRHGRKGNCDPVLSTFEASWRRLCQEVIAEGGETASHFQN